MHLRVNLLGRGPSFTQKKIIIYRAAVSQRLRNTGLDYTSAATWNKTGIRNNEARWPDHCLR
jgi:hypothetical protein